MYGAKKQACVYMKTRVPQERESALSKVRFVSWLDLTVRSARTSEKTTHYTPLQGQNDKQATMVEISGRIKKNGDCFYNCVYLVSVHPHSCLGLELKVGYRFCFVSK